MGRHTDEFREERQWFVDHVGQPSMLDDIRGYEDAYRMDCEEAAAGSMEAWYAAELARAEAMRAEMEACDALPPPRCKYAEFECLSAAAHEARAERLRAIELSSYDDGTIPF